MNFIKKIIEKKAFKSNELSKNQLANLIVRNPIKDIPNFGDPIVDTQFKIGDIIACNYILLNLVGKGGMGVVYLVYNKNLDYTFALKTIKEEFSSDANARYSFKREIETWIKLGQHPYIVSALDVFQFNGRYYVGMEFISPSDEMEGSSLEYYIRRGPLKTAQIIKWAIQFCFGIEYAYKNGLSCHLDIKPSNILIDLDGNVRISDFGLSKIKYNSYENLTFVYNNIKSCYLTQYGCGTPPYMPPEQFRSGKFNHKNDIYSFGITLYEMCTGRLPFMVKQFQDKGQKEFINYWSEWENIHRNTPIPEIGSNLGKIIKKCMAKLPEYRFNDFSEIRKSLSKIYESFDLKPIFPGKAVEYVEDIINKGLQFDALGYIEEALQCYERALTLDPNNSKILHSKAQCLNHLGHFIEAINCHKRATKFAPMNSNQWNNLGICYLNNKDYINSIKCFEKAIKLDFRNNFAWYNKGDALQDLNQYKKSIKCYDNALKINSMDRDAWNNKALSLLALKHYHEAINCFEKAINIDPQDFRPYKHKAECLMDINRYKEAIIFFDKSLELNKNQNDVFANKGICLLKLSQQDEAKLCFKKAASDPETLEKLSQIGIVKYKDFYRALILREINYEEDYTLIIELIRDIFGDVIGLWFSNTNVTKDVKILKVKLTSSLARYINREQLNMVIIKDKYRIVKNLYDDRGGCFVMLVDNFAPGEKINYE